MIKRLFYTILVGMLMLLSSCSETPSTDEITKSKKEIITDLNQLYTDGFITQQNANDAIANIVSFEQKNFIGQYWWVVLFIFVSISLITTFILLTDSEEEHLAQPIKKSNAYRVVAFVGFLGGHNIYLKKHNWIGVFTLILTIVFFFWNYKYVMYFYDIPSVFFISNINCIYLEEMGTFYWWQIMLITLYFINLLTGLVFTPFWVYQFNGNYFRKNKDNDAILNGNSLDVDHFYKSKLIPHMDKVKSDVEDTKNILKDESYIIEEDGDDKISGFFKNIFTLGKSSELKNKIQRLRALHWCCELLQIDLDTLDEYNEDLYSYLSYYRVAAYRNLYLAKELISVIKDNVSSQQQELIKDEFPNLIKPENNSSTNLQFDSSQISFDSERFFDTLGNSFTKSFDPINKKLESEKEISKQDLLSAGFEFAFDSVIAGIEGIIDQYQNVSASLRETQKQINEAVEYLGEAFPAIMRYQAEMARQSEIMVALSQFNKAFIMAYEPMRQKVFGRPTFSQFLHGINKDTEYFKSIEFRHDIHHLIQVCTEYNKIYNTKFEQGACRAKKNSMRSASNCQSDTAKEITDNVSINNNESPVPQVLDREFVLTTIRKVLKNKHIVEGNTLTFLDLTQNGPMVKNLCEELSAVSGKKIDKQDIFKRQNIREVIDLVLKK